MASFSKEEILPSSDPSLPFYSNLAPTDSKPVDELVRYFKLWKKFIKLLIFYMGEIAIMKEYTNKINLQLINLVIFPGQMNLPVKYMTEVSLITVELSKKQNPNNPMNPIINPIMNPIINPLMKHGNHSALDLLASQSRPHLFKTKLNQSFLKPSFSKTVEFGKEFGKELNPLHRISSEKPEKNSSLNPSHTRLHLNPQMLQQQGAQPSQQSPGAHETRDPIVTAPKIFQNDTQIPPNYFNSKSSLFPNLPQLLIDNHYQAYEGELKTVRDLKLKIIPRLENLLRNLTAKIKEIKSSLKNENFANNDILELISDTGRVLRAYMGSMEAYNADTPIIKSSKIEDSDGDVLDDPFLLKLQLDYQLKRQMVQENYGFAAYLNLQGIAKDLSNYVLKELKASTSKFGKLVNNEKCWTDTAMTSLYQELLQYTNNTKAEAEWDYFISHNMNFINTNPNTDGPNKYKGARSFAKVKVPYADSIHNKCLRSGRIYKKLKILKNYSVFFYIMTCNFLHEFKIPEDLKRDKHKIGGFIDNDSVPEKLYNLNDFIIKPKNDDKFVLHLISKKTIKYTFKCSTDDEFRQWFVDLSELLKFGPRHKKRFEFVEKAIQGGLMASPAKKADKGLSPSILESSGKVNAPTHINLPGTNNSTMLNGAYTPVVVTPHLSDSDTSAAKERNPFDTVFVDKKGVKSNASTPNSLVSTPTFHPNELAAKLSPVAALNGVNRPPSLNLENLTINEPASQVIDHENYLILQREYLRQQQQVLDSQIKETQQAQQALHNAQHQFASSVDLSGSSSRLEPGSTPPIHRQLSATSLSSFNMPSTNIGNFLDRFQFPQTGHLPDQSETSLVDKPEKANFLIPHIEHTEH